MITKKIALAKYSLTLLLTISILVFGTITTKAVPLDDIPTGYMLLTSDVAENLVYGEDLNPNIYFNTQNGYYYPYNDENYHYLPMNGEFIYNSVTYDGILLHRVYSEGIGNYTAYVAFANDKTGVQSAAIMSGEENPLTESTLLSFTSIFITSSPSIVAVGGTKLYDSQSSFVSDLLYGRAYVKLLEDSSSSYLLTMNEFTEDAFKSPNSYMSEAYKVLYQLNDLGVDNHLASNSSSLPKYISNVSSIKITNGSQYDLGISSSSGDFRILASDLSHTYTLTAATTLSFGFLVEDTETPTTYDIEGNYLFNSSIEFPPDDLTQFSFFANISGYEYEYMQFDSTNNILSYIGDISIGIDTVEAWSALEGGTKLYSEEFNYQYIFINSSTVNEVTYNWLNANGTWGEYNESVSDDFQIGSFLLDGLNNFLAFEIYQGFTLLQLLYLVIAIPLLIYILKLFLGG